MRFVVFRPPLVYILACSAGTRHAGALQSTTTHTPMPLRRASKIWLAVIGIPLILLVSAAAAAKLYFSGDRLKALLIPKIEEAIHRPVNVQSVSLTFLPSLGVEIDSLMIANARGREFSASPFLSLDRLLLKVRLLSLLGGKVEVTMIVFDQPHLLVEFNRWGESNYADFMGRADTGATPAPATSHPGEPAPSAGMGFLFANVQVRNGQVDYIDRKSNTAIRLGGLNHVMQLDVDSRAHLMRVDAQTSADRFSYGTLQSPMLTNLRLTTDAQLMYNQDDDRLTIQKGIVTVQDIVLVASGTVSAVTKQPLLAVNVEADRLNIADLLSLIPAEYMKKAEGLKGTGSARVRVAVTGVVSDSSKPEFRGTVSAADASIQYAQLPQPITKVSIVASFERSSAKQEFTIERLSAVLGNNPVNVSMKVVNFDDPWLTMTVGASLNLAEVKDYYPLTQGTELSGSLTANMNISGKTSNPSAMTGSGTIDFRNVTIKTPGSSKPLQNLQGTVSITNNTVESKKLSMVLGRSDLTVAFNLKNYLSLASTDKAAPRASATVSLTSNSLSTKDLISDTTTTKTTGKGKESPAAPRTGSAMVLPNADMDVTASVGTLAMEKFTLTNFKALLSVSNGMFTLRSCTMNAFDGSVSARGALNLQNLRQPQFDMTLNAAGVDAHALLSKFTSFGSKMFGRLTLATTLKGSLDDTLGLIPSTLNGKGNVQAHDGSLVGVNVNKDIASLVKLPALDTVHYKDWSNDFSVANGRLVMKDLKINALDADYLVNGSQGLDGSLDYTMSLVLPEKTSSRISISGFAGKAVDLFRDNTGRVRLDFSVGGTMDNPKVGLNTSTASKKAEDLVKQKAAEEAKKLQDKLKKQGTDLLKGLLKKK